ncbi:hypothetical protein HY479_00975 [Candidatus Uhrbacteria bacterium]|nr:hypothetical protein [Candidatus Uhrbacteria bacterium]
MNDVFFLDLRDTPRVVDALVEAIPFADGKLKADAETWVKDYRDGTRLDREKLAAMARKVARATWPARAAVMRHFAHEGADTEWTTLNAAVRPSTAHLIKRVRRAVDAGTIDELLRHAESDTALRDEERLEIAEVRKHVHEDFWKEHGKTLAPTIRDQERVLEGYDKRLDALRETAAVFPPALQDEVFSKINRYEDRILFGLESVPMEILDKEVQYYKEQKEISPLEAG